MDKKSDFFSFWLSVCTLWWNSHRRTPVFLHRSSPVSFCRLQTSSISLAIPICSTIIDSATHNRDYGTNQSRTKVSVRGAGAESPAGSLIVPRAKSLELQPKPAKTRTSTRDRYTQQFPLPPRCGSIRPPSSSRYSPLATLATSCLPVGRSPTFSKWAGTRRGETADQTVERSTARLLTSIVIHQSKAIILLLMKFQFAFSAFHIDIFHIATELW